MKEIVAMYDCEVIEFVTSHTERTCLWEARHNLAYSFIHGFPGCKMMVTDVCVPISELAGAVRYAQEQLHELDLIGGVTGHVGDGNFHVILMIDLEDPEENARANTFNEVFKTMKPYPVHLKHNVPKKGFLLFLCLDDEQEI